MTSKGPESIMCWGIGEVQSDHKGQGRECSRVREDPPNWAKCTHGKCIHSEEEINLWLEEHSKEKEAEI